MNIKVSKISEDNYSINDSEEALNKEDLSTLAQSLGADNVEDWLENLEKNKMANLEEVVSEKGVIVDLYEVDYPTPQNPLHETQELAKNLDEKEDFLAQYLYPGSTTEDVIVGLRSDIIEDREPKDQIPKRQALWRDMLLKMSWKPGIEGEGKLRVWWKSNLQDIVRYYSINSVEEAKTMLDKLTKGDLSNPKITWNAGGLEILEDTGKGLDWGEWYDEQGNDIDTIMDSKNND